MIWKVSVLRRWLNKKKFLWARANYKLSVIEMGRFIEGRTTIRFRSEEPSHFHTLHTLRPQFLAISHEERSFRFKSQGSRKGTERGALENRNSTRPKSSSFFLNAILSKFKILYRLPRGHCYCSVIFICWSRNEIHTVSSSMTSRRGHEILKVLEYSTVASKKCVGEIASRTEKL